MRVFEVSRAWLGGLAPWPHFARPQEQRPRLGGPGPLRLVGSRAAAPASPWTPTRAVPGGGRVAGALPERFRAVVDLVIGTGMRQGEVFGLDVGRVPFIRNLSVDVRQQLISLSPNPLHLAGPKSQSEWVIPIAQPTVDALALPAYPAATVTIEDRRNPRRPVTRDARLMFTSTRGRPISRSMWSQIWRPAARGRATGGDRAALPSARLRVHVDQRRVLGEGGADAASLGHASAKITLDTYVHLWGDDDDRTRDAVASRLAGFRNPADVLRTEPTVTSGDRA